MKFDSVIMGGGLSGLTCGIALLKAGMKVAVVSFGQSSMHFGTGAFDLLGYDSRGVAVTNPLEAAKLLAPKHPYQKLGVDNIATLAQAARQMLADAGVKTHGETLRNHFRITPVGAVKPTWLTMEGFAMLDEEHALPWKKVTVVNIMGFLDFPTKFLVAGLHKLGVDADVKGFSTPALEVARKSPSEMRAINVAKVLTNMEEVKQVATQINKTVGNADAVFMPAVVGMNNDENAGLLKEQVKVPLFFVPTLPPSVPGIRAHARLKANFLSLGGTFLGGDQVLKGGMEGQRVTSVETALLTDEKLIAKHYVLATGSFMSHGLATNYKEVYEPIFHLDVDAVPQRERWTGTSVFDAQPFMEFGVMTDADFKVMKNGKPVDNLFAIGSILSGHNRVKLADGEGVSMLTALHVADTIAKTERRR